MLSILVVFLCLVALFESSSVPFAVMMVVPLGVMGAVAAAAFLGIFFTPLFHMLVRRVFGGWSARSGAASGAPRSAKV